jgi:hypothetical protein
MDLSGLTNRGLSEAIEREANAPRPSLPDRRNRLLPASSKKKAE